MLWIFGSRLNNSVFPQNPKGGREGLSGPGMRSGEIINDHVHETRCITFRVSCCVFATQDNTFGAIHCHTHTRTDGRQSPRIVSRSTFDIFRKTVLNFYHSNCPVFPPPDCANPSYLTISGRNGSIVLKSRSNTACPRCFISFHSGSSETICARLAHPSERPDSFRG